MTTMLAGETTAEAPVTGAGDGVTEGQTGQVAAVQTGTTGEPGATVAEGAGSGDPAGKKTDAEAKPAGAPEKYEFKAPEGQEFDGKVLTPFSEVARELNLSQESAQKVLDRMAPALAARQTEAIEAAQAQWKSAATADKEFGGDKLTENLAVASKALEQFGTPELKTLLSESGLGNHPEIIRAFYRAGKAISEDRLITSTTAGKPDPGDFASKLYPNQK